MQIPDLLRLKRRVARTRGREETTRGMGPWNPTFAHRTLKDGAPGILKRVGKGNPPVEGDELPPELETKRKKSR
jgi:hypothetical protein